ncbi:sugar transferase [Flavobacterium sp.]|uniref:sugar transferase n=1 Tax=Flavobacterium sp. TaxID=239 RepID=UPI0028BDA9F0|nr:sugar transferase [Flavobacterium sp.]
MLLKRLFDIVFSATALVFVGWIIFLCWLVATIDTRENGFFLQKRVGQHARYFTILKIRTMKDGKVTWLGAFFRKTKLDELPQFINVLIGDMSVVGPRPDIPGYYDLLEGESRKILELKPGLTSLASLKYFNEEYLLEKQENPLHFNDTVIFPDKVRMNLQYYHTRTFWGDVKIVLATLFQKIF